MIFSINKRACFCDTDAGGIVYHSKYLDFCEEARLEYFLKYNITQRDLWVKHNLMFVLKSCEVNYKTPARAEDLLTITIEKCEVNKLITTIYQNVYRGEELLVECKINLVAVQPITLKLVRRLPEEVLQIINVKNE